MLPARLVADVGVSDRTVLMPVAVTYAAVDPLQHAQSLRAERSLLFVAATWAREAPAIAWHRAPSPFLAGSAS